MFTALVVAVLQLGPSGSAVATFVDPKSKEELLLIEHDDTLQVFYASKAGRKRQELKVTGEYLAKMVQVTFPDPAKKYVLEWTSAHEHVKCSNPDGTQQTFDRVDVDRPPFTSPAAVVRALYAQFPPEAQLTHELNFVAGDAAARTPLLTAKLAEALTAARAACQPGEACAPDFDVLYDTQDLAITNLKVGEPDKAHVVTVSFENAGKKASVRVKTEREDGGWKVSDLQYGKGESLAKLLQPPR